MLHNNSHQYVREGDAERGWWWKINLILSTQTLLNFEILKIFTNKSSQIYFWMKLKFDKINKS